MSGAPVLGGGGPVGIGWEAGFLAGSADAGVSLRDADLVVGTSAGSVVGAQLTSGRRLAEVVAPIGETPPWMPSGSDDGAPDLAELMAAGSVAAASEDEFVEGFAFLSARSPRRAPPRCARADRRVAIDRQHRRAGRTE
jgi:NTE family protein